MLAMKKIKLYDYQQRMLEEIVRMLTTKKITLTIALYRYQA